MVVGEQGVQVGDEVLAIELHHVVVEVDLRQDLQVGVQVQGGVDDGRFKKELD